MSTLISCQADVHQAWWWGILCCLNQTGSSPLPSPALSNLFLSCVAVIRDGWPYNGAGYGQLYSHLCKICIPTKLGSWERKDLNSEAVRPVRSVTLDDPGPTFCVYKSRNPEVTILSWGKDILWHQMNWSLFCRFKNRASSRLTWKHCCVL